MSQREILTFLKANKGRWFSFNELKSKCESAKRPPLSRLVKWGFVKVKYGYVNRTIKYCDRKAAKTAKRIAYYAYNNEIEE